MHGQRNTNANSHAKHVTNGLTNNVTSDYASTSNYTSSELPSLGRSNGVHGRAMRFI